MLQLSKKLDRIGELFKVPNHQHIPAEATIERSSLKIILRLIIILLNVVPSGSSWAQNVQTDHHGDYLSKMRHGNDSAAAYKYNLTTIFVSSLYLFDSNFSGIKQFGLISSMIVIKEFVSLTTVAIETGKKIKLL